MGGLFDTCRDGAAFKQHLRDFLVSLKEFGGGDELFTEEKEAEVARKVRRGPRRARARAGPPRPTLTPPARRAPRRRSRAQAAEVQKRQEAVPGIINPHAIQDDMND